MFVRYCALAITNDSVELTIVDNAKMAKDQHDRATRNIFERELNAQRQRRFAQRQRALGRRKKYLWLTEEENKRVRDLVRSMRGEKGNA